MKKKLLLQSKRRPLPYYLGTVLIILSLAGFAIVLYPLFQAYNPSALTITLDEKRTMLEIPKIQARALIIEDVDPWNQIEYRSALRQGVAHAKGTVLPDKKGLVFLFAHSSGLPWEITRYNTIFLRLGELQKGDSIYIYRNSRRYTYRVIDKKTVWPSEVSYLLNTTKDELILQTCTPIGTDFQRLLVFAAPVL